MKKVVGSVRTITRMLTARVVSHSWVIHFFMFFSSSRIIRIFPWAFHKVDFRNVRSTVAGLVVMKMVLRGLVKSAPSGVVGTVLMNIECVDESFWAIKSASGCPSW